MNRTILAATGNKGKIRELRSLLEPHGIHVATPAEIGGLVEPEESGAAFAENAEIKAVAAAKASGMDSVADDSGLEVVALNGRPGIHSARYGGPGASDADRVELLLQELSEIEDRRARFVCAIAVCGSDGKVETALGEIHGRILRKARGVNGFGYDPIFVPDGYELTFAELPGEVKSAISHRAMALRRAMPSILAVLERPEA